MIRLIFTSLFLLSGLQYSYGQNFGPVGTTWHYSVGVDFNPWVELYQKIEVKKDTLFQGKKCQYLSLKRYYSLCTYTPQVPIVYSDSNKVFFWVEELGQFSLLYDFNPQPGDS